MAKRFSPIILFNDSSSSPVRFDDENCDKKDMDMDIDVDPDPRAQFIAIRGTGTGDSASVVSPPSSYSSSSSSSIDALAKTMSPARIDIHRKSIQRMIQRNSLLWWELVRYTRNLERKEREEEQEHEKENEDENELQKASSSRPRLVHHVHHHHHHHHPFLPPLHPQQHTLASSKSLPSLKSNKAQSRPHPYEYLANATSALQSQAQRSRDDADRRLRSLAFDSHEYVAENEEALIERDNNVPRLPSMRRSSGSGIAYRSSSRTPSPSPSLSPPPTRPSSFDGRIIQRSTESCFAREMSPRTQQQLQSNHQRQQSHHQPTARPSPHLRTQAPLEEFPRQSYSQQQQRQQQQQHGSRAEPGYDQTPSSSLSSTSFAKKLPPIDAGSSYSGLPPSPHQSAGVHSSSEQSSTASSPRSRDLSSSTLAHGYTQHGHQHQYPSQRDMNYPSSHLYHHRSYPSSHSESGSTSYRPRGSEYPSPQQSYHQHQQQQQHQYHHHHSHHDQQGHHSPSRSSHPPHVAESLPRPVPVKPAATLHSNPAKPLTLSSTAATNSTSVPSVAHIQDRSSPVSSSSQPPADPSNNSNNVNNTSNSNANHGALNPDRKRRGNLPKSVTSVLKSWLVQNAIHPYPTEEEKMRLSEATQLSMNQISNWFINARRRILQPILVEAAAAAVAGTDAPMENVLIVRKGKGSRMQVEMEGVTSTPTSCPNVSGTSTTTSTSTTISTMGVQLTTSTTNNTNANSQRDAPSSSTSASQTP